MRVIDINAIPRSSQCNLSKYPDLAEDATKHRAYSAQTGLCLTSNRGHFVLTCTPFELSTVD